MRGMFPFGLAGLMLGMSSLGLDGGEGKPAGVKVGDTAPSFQATDDQGHTWKSTDHIGKKTLALFFFPADFTGG